jgi:hypothetical protein
VVRYRVLPTAEQAVVSTEGRNVDMNAPRNIAAGRAVTARGDLGASRSANREPQLCAPAASVMGGVGIPWSQPGEDVKPARLACATVPAYVRDSKWSPTPTANHNGAAVRSQALRCLSWSAMGPALSRAFLFV